jgi:capsular exopolysaccharide synthesis family protein
MSKIFDALQKARGVLPDTLPRVLVDQFSASSPYASPEETDEASWARGEDEVLAQEGNGDLRIVVIAPPKGVPVFPFDGEDDGAAEEYRMIRTRIEQKTEAGKLIMVTSPEVGDGKTLSAINIAGALALKNDINVLLVDADLHRPALAKTLGIPESPGLTEVLRAKCSLRDAVVQTDRFSNLYVLPAGEAVANRAELFDSAPWRQICLVFESQFHHAVVDAPPVDAVAEYPLIQGSCHYLLVVIRPDSTNRSRCMHALRNVPKEKLLGTILNATPNWFLARSSHYQYYGYRTHHNEEAPKKAGAATKTLA